MHTHHEAACLMFRRIDQADVTSEVLSSVQRRTNAEKIFSVADDKR